MCFCVEDITYRRHNRLLLERIIIDVVKKRCQSREVITLSGSASRRRYCQQADIQSSSDGITLHRRKLGTKQQNTLAESP